MLLKVYPKKKIFEFAIDLTFKKLIIKLFIKNNSKDNPKIKTNMIISLTRVSQ